jgi:hypothetical protein
MKFTMTDAKAVTSVGSTICTIAQIIMEGPTAGRGGKAEVDEDFRGLVREPGCSLSDGIMDSVR